MQTIIARGWVRETFSSGAFSVDAAVPIGRGQRQLILGDRGRGKYTLALDSMFSSGIGCAAHREFVGGQFVVSSATVFVFIGRRKAEVLSTLNTIFRLQRVLLNSSAFVVGGAADEAPFQWVAPFTGVTVAEFFMLGGWDATFICNDLSRHANAYRQISLLLRRPPARQAYPGDIFYLHARLLERCAKLADTLGAGSCTGLPIVQTQDGELSAYIPTNVISITDGQLFIDGRLFNRGLQPAVNIGLSVSRIGSAAQTFAIKESAGALRLELALYRELDKNRQFKDQLDAPNRALLFRGDFLSVFFQQPKNMPGSSGFSLAMLRFSNQALGIDPLFVNSEKETVDVAAVRAFKQRAHKSVFLAATVEGLSIANTNFGWLEDGLNHSLAFDQSGGDMLGSMILCL